MQHELEESVADSFFLVLAEEVRMNNADRKAMLQRLILMSLFRCIQGWFRYLTKEGKKMLQVSPAFMSTGVSHMIQIDNMTRKADNVDIGLYLLFKPFGYE